MNWHAIENAVKSAIGEAFQIRKTMPVGGGCINSAYQLIGRSENFFVKVNQKKAAWIFDVEELALNEINESDTVRTPRAICTGIEGDRSFLVLEWISMNSLSPNCERLFGSKLAEFHRHQHRYYGWHCDNAIGTTHQHNAQSTHWLEFWRENRLKFQLGLAAANGYHGTIQKKGELLCQRLDAFFTDYNPIPSILHGDLWSGNFAMDEAGAPVIFDPACYYGDREADIAMTELFGGLGADFYSAYNEAFPPHEGYRNRKILYNLYHMLNHLNLFGAGYLSRVENMIDCLLAEIK